MLRKGYSLVELLIIFLIICIFSLAILEMNLFIIKNSKLIYFKDYQNSICRTIIEFYKIDSGNFNSSYVLYFDDFEKIKEDIKTYGLSDYLNLHLEDDQEGKYKLSLEFKTVGFMNAIKVICETCEDNIKTTLFYFK